MSAVYVDDRTNRTFFRARPSRTGRGWVCWTGPSPALGDSPWDVPVGYETMIGYGPTSEEAIYALKRRFVQ